MRSTKTMWLGSMVLMGLLAPNMVRADVDPATELKALSARYQAAVKEARDKKVEPDVTALQKELADRAKEDVKGVDPTKVEPSKALAWAQLFSRAQEPKQMILAAQHFLTSNPEPQPKFAAQMLILSGYDDLKDANGIIRTVKEVKLPSPALAGQLVGMTTNVIDTVTEKKGPGQSLELLKLVEAEVPFDQLKAPQSDAVIFAIAGTRSELLDKEGKRADALATLDEG